MFLEARRIKTEDEIALLVTAASMVDAAYEELYAFLRPGVKENECVGLVNKIALRPGQRARRGGQRHLRRAMLTAPPRLQRPHLIRPGDPAFFDILHSFNGYRTCYYRTFAVGSAVGRPARRLHKCREFIDTAIALVKPGATTADVVSVWPRAEEFGFANEEAAFGLQYGHGVGLSIWEKPIFSRMVSLEHPEVLEEGMVFALETYWPA